LETQLVSFNGHIINNQAVLEWITALENESLHFDVEKSTDGINFVTIATLNSYNDYSSEQNIYSFTDPVQMTQKAYYRIKMRNNHTQSKYSRTIQLSVIPDILSFISVINPFNNELVFDVSSGYNVKANAELIDQFGKIVKKTSFTINKGVSHIVLDKANVLSTGIYILRVQTAGTSIQRKVMKKGD
jgi:hypothetical protein